MKFDGTGSGKSGIEPVVEMVDGREDAVVGEIIIGESKSSSSPLSCACCASKDIYGEFDDPSRLNCEISWIVGT